MILASSQPDRLAAWKKALSDFSCKDLIVDKLLTDRLDSLRDEVVRSKPDLLMLDYELLGLHATNGAASLRRLCTETNVIIISGDISEGLEWELLKAGVRGICRYDIPAKFLKQIVVAVKEGELWIRRSLACRLIDELAKSTSKNKAYRATMGLLNELTQREYDIAVRVGNGESNKQIALACEITERTVKAHLTEIFLKVGVADRLNLALVMTSDSNAAVADLNTSLDSSTL